MTAAGGDGISCVSVCGVAHVIEARGARSSDISVRRSSEALNEEESGVT